MSSVGCAFRLPIPNLIQGIEMISVSMSIWITRLNAGATVIYLITYLRLRDNTAGRNAARKPDVTANGRAAPDGDTAKNSGASVDNYIILDNRVPNIPFYQRTMLIRGKAFGAQRYGLI